LSTRNDELLAAQLLFASHPAPGTFIPETKYRNVVDSSVTTKRASTSSNRPPAYKSAVPTSPSDHELPTEIVGKDSHKIRASQRKSPSANVNPETPPPPLQSPLNVTAKTTASKSKPFVLVAGQRFPARSPAPDMGTGQRLIRRVQTVVRIPVKREDSDEDSASVSPSVYVSAEGTGTSLHRQTNKMATKRKKVIQSDVDDEDYRYGVDRYQSSQVVSDEEEEDDELMMGVETNRRELGGSERTFAPEIRPSNGRSSTAKTAPSPNKRRKRR